MRPTIVIACRVMQELLETMLGKDIRRAYMDILLHNTPKKLAAALQAETACLRMLLVRLLGGEVTS